MSRTARGHGAGVQLAGLADGLALVAAAAAIGGWITSTSLDGWYAQLAKPRWTQP